MTMRPTDFVTSTWFAVDFNLHSMDLEITPEPTPEERAVIEAALAADPQDPPMPWRPDPFEP
jgi:hypothetical protein